MPVVTCQCGGRFRAPEHLQGKRIACPSCGSPIDVPALQPIVVACSCGQRFQAKPELAGRTVACPACGGALQVGTTPQPLSQPVAESDPFGAPIAPDAPSYSAPQFPQSKPPSPSRGLPVGLIVGIGVGAVVLLLLFIGGSIAWKALTGDGNNTTVGGALEAAPAAAHEPGDPMSPAELEAFYRIPAGEQDITQDWLAATRVFTRQAIASDPAARGLPYVASRNKPPPVDAAWRDLQRAEQFLANYESELRALHAAAEQDGAVRYPTKFADTIAMEIPHADYARAAAGVLRLEAYVSARKGDYAHAAQCIRTMYRLGATFDCYPLVIIALVRFGIDGGASTLLRQFHTEFSADDIAMLEAELRRPDYQAHLLQAILGERAIGLPAFDAPDAAMDLIMESEIAANLTPADREKLSRLAKVGLDEDQATYVRWMGKYVAAARTPFPQALGLADLGQEESQRLTNATAKEKASATFSLLLVPALGHVFNATGLAIARREATLTVLAIDRYRKKHNGSLPTALNQLVPEFMSAVPSDPFDGKPLRYQPGTDQYVLYSVGRDRKDDDGRGDPAGFPDFNFRISIR